MSQLNLLHLVSGYSFSTATWSLIALQETSDIHDDRCNLDISTLTVATQ
jgi:hypothetical protein